MKMSESRNYRTHGDYPPYSRLFIVCSRTTSEDDFREGFSEFGKIEDIYIVKDRKTGDNKGIAYIQYGKTSEAARALDMNKKRLRNSSTPIKVLLASDNKSGDDRDVDEILKAKRLFVMIPKAMDEKELENEFGRYGDVDGVSIVRNKDTMESKGLGFVRYRTFYDAACAFENADRKYKAVFAEPKKISHGSKGSSSVGGGSDSFSAYNNPFASVNTPNPEGYTRLNVTFSPYLHQGLLHTLFDIIPGLELCNIKINHQRRCGTALVGYTTPALAAYAREKFDGFEYPPGQPMIVAPDLSSGYRQASQPSGRDLGSINSQLKSAMSGGNIDLVKLTETIAQATSLIQAAASGGSGEALCSVGLPPTRPLADVDAPVAKRLFIVCQPRPPPIQLLKDAFRRFGDMIDMYILPHKTVGYVKYASLSAANEAMRLLHGAEICGVRMKVLEAEEQPNWAQKHRHDSMQIDNDNDSDESNKRAKYEALLEYGADPNLRCYNDATDLNSQLRPVLVEYIASNPDPDPKIVNLLLRRGARVIMKTQFRDPDGILNSLQHVATPTSQNVFFRLLDAAQAFDLCMIRRNNVLLAPQKQALVERASRPLSLLAQARFALRGQMANLTVGECHEMGLPSCLHKFVQFDYS